MANSKDSLLQMLKGQTASRGWGAIVSFNRAKVNHLLAQQHIARFSTDSFLPAIRGTLQLEGAETVELSGIILSAPRLSFENASLQDSRARLHMDIVGGTVTHYSAVPGSPVRALSSFNISEQHGYRLDADIELRKVVGGINENSEVILDISEATEFKTNLIDQGIGPELTGSFFKSKFEALPAEQQVYSLGLLDFNADDLLAPKDFYILTQAAPEGRNARSDSYGEGAVVLFVRTKNNFYDGALPTDESEFPYLIPDDKVAGEDRSKYSGSLLIARQAVMYWFIVPYIRNNIGRGLNFEVGDDTTDPGDFKLTAVSGQYDLGKFDITYDDWPHHYHFIVDNLAIRFSNAMNIYIRPDHRLAIEWHDAPVETFLYWDDVSGSWDTHKNIDVRLKFDLTLIFDNALDIATNVIKFTQSSDSVMSSEVTIYRGEGTHKTLIEKAKEALDAALDTMTELFAAIDIPEINFFGINHLLFPEHNALILKEAYLPGDLVMFGEIDPALTSFSLDPLYVTVKTGDTLQFSIVELRYRTRAANITWSARNVDGTRSQGLITDTGLYSAPTIGQLEDKTTRNVVSATFTDPQTQETRTASALVVIVASSMAITPALHAIDLRTPRDVTFKISMLSGNPVTWTPLPPEQGTLSGAGYEVTYRPPGTPPSGKFLPVKIEAVDTGTQEKCSGTVLLINGVMPMDVKPAFHPGLAPAASLHLSLSEQRDGARDLQWSVAAGEGTVDPSGTFKAPEVITLPYTVVQCRYFDGAGTESGYGVIHLSEIAPRAEWEELTEFTVKEVSTSKLLFANGLQQVQVRVAVKALDAEKLEVPLTPSELNSMRLIVANSGNDLPFVGEQGVPVSAPEDPDEKKWGINESRNGYQYYKGALLSPEPPANDGSGKSLYIQTRGETPLSIAVALTRADHVEFKSTENGGSEEKNNIIKITPVPSPTYSTDNYELTRSRVEGKDDNDYELNTVDYYYVRFNQSVETIKFVSIAFEGPSSMVQWESRQYAEQMGSYTGFAFSNSRTLSFEPLLMQSIPQASRPSLDVVQGKEAPEGAVLISLHRRSDFTFDNDSEFVRPLKVSLIDDFGNLHRITLQFKSPNDRNELIIVAGH